MLPLKKLVMSLLIAALILSLCACGSSEEDDLTATQDSAAMHTNFDAAGTFVDSVIDTSEMTASTQEDETGLYQYWVYNGESANDEFGVDIKIDNKKITLAKTTVNDLQDLGFELQSEEESAEPGSILGITVKKDEKFGCFAIENKSDAKQEISNMVVFQYSGDSDENTLDFNYNGLKKGSSLEDVIKTLGTPKSNITMTGNANGTRITLNYVNSSTEDNTIITDSLDIGLIYHPKKNTATLTHLNLTRYEEKMPEGTTAE